MKTSSYSAVPSIPVANPASGAASWSATIVRWSSIVIANLVHWNERAKQRRQLSELDDRLLADIGVNPIDASYESGKHFWQS